MALTKEQLKARDGRLTASMVGVLMHGDEAKILNLWKGLVGDPTHEQPDLRGVWPVRLGEVTEELQLDWYEYKHGTQVTRRGEVVAREDWAAATLDGWDENKAIPIECKHVGGREPLERILARYLAQVHWQMYVCGTKTAVMSIIEGANEPLIEPVDWSHDYGNELVARAITFMNAVRNLTPPVEMPPVEAPVKAIKTYDMTGKNDWADFAVTWLENHQAQRKAELASKGIKLLVPKDAQRAHGHGVEITRDRANRMMLRAA